jgi:UDP-glucose 4-epimerase
LDQGSRTYNLGNGKGFSVKEVIDMAREITGRPIPAEVVARRPGDPAVLVASSHKIRRELGWEPKHSDLRNIIESAWNWHISHPQGYSTQK